MSKAERRARLLTTPPSPLPPPSKADRWYASTGPRWLAGISFLSMVGPVGALLVRMIRLQCFTTSRPVLDLRRGV